MDYISRQEAIQLDLSHYFTGAPCKHGHVSNRTTITRKCVECSRLAAAEFHHNNREIILEKRRQQYADDPNAAEKCRAAYAANPEIKKRSERKRREKYPEFFKQKSAEYYQENADAIKTKVKAYNKANIEIIADRKRKKYSRLTDLQKAERSEIRRQRWKNNPELREAAYEKAKIYREKNADLVRSHKTNRAAQLRDLDQKITSQSISAIRLFQQNRCLYCDADCSSEFHVDHIVPLSREGTNEIANLAIACPSCNLRKQARPPLVFLAILWKDLGWL